MSFISSWFLVVKRERREIKRESGGGQNTNEKETRRVELTASLLFFPSPCVSCLKLASVGT